MREGLRRAKEACHVRADDVREPDCRKKNIKEIASSIREFYVAMSHENPLYSLVFIERVDERADLGPSQTILPLIPRFLCVPTFEKI